MQTQSGYMSIKNGILYQVHYPNKSWVEEISRVYEKNESGFFPEKKYEGEIENGEPNGDGILTYTDEGTYVGQFVNGLREGIGTMTWGRMAIVHGYVYEGQWKNDEIHGQGTMTDPKGIKMKGKWIDGEAQDGHRRVID